LSLLAQQDANKDSQDLTAKQEKEVKIQIWKDVNRTMQENDFFRQKVVMDRLEELLYIWAREHPDFKYQQGMNEILAIVVTAVFSELSTQQEESEDSDEDELSTQKLIHILHDSEHAWSDVYCLYERILDLGVKELYFKELEEKPRGESTMGMGERERKAYKMELSRQENQKTQLRRRSIKIFNNYLKEIDHDLWKHIQKLDLQPEFILLRWLRCLMSREYSLPSLLYIWDFFLGGITESHRAVVERAQIKSDVSQSFYNYEDYMNSDSLNDSLVNLDYICVAMLCSVKEFIL
jgi:TBC1 domain family protein 5